MSHSYLPVLQICHMKFRILHLQNPYSGVKDDQFRVITPGASTVAKFKTIMTLNLRDSKLSQTERQVNALIMSCLFTHPVLLTCRVEPTKRLGVC